MNMNKKESLTIKDVLKNEIISDVPGVNCIDDNSNIFDFEKVRDLFDEILEMDLEEFDIDNLFCYYNEETKFLKENDNTPGRNSIYNLLSNQAPLEYVLYPILDFKNKFFDFFDNSHFDFDSNDTVENICLSFLDVIQNELIRIIKFYFNDELDKISEVKEFIINNNIDFDSFSVIYKDFDKLKEMNESI